MNTKNDRATWLKGENARCSMPPKFTQQSFRFVLLGAPGVGKGTQAELLCERFHTCHLSTGDVFRMAKCLAESERTPAIQTALGHMRRGELVPDGTVLDLISERARCLRCHGGFLLDGFPRTVRQAEALDALLEREKVALTAVVNYELPLGQIVERLAGRRTCADCKAVFHVATLPPLINGVCDHCGGQLVQREDDRPESIRVRMAAYEASTSPLAEFYRRKNLLVSITADGSPQEIFERTLALLPITNSGRRQHQETNEGGQQPKEYHECRSGI